MKMWSTWPTTHVVKIVASAIWRSCQFVRAGIKIWVKNKKLTFSNIGMLGNNLAGTSHIWSPCQFAGNANRRSVVDPPETRPLWPLAGRHNMVAIIIPSFVCGNSCQAMMLAWCKILMVRGCKVMAHYTHGYHSAWVVLRMLDFIVIVITVIIIVWSKEKQQCCRP